MKIASKTLALLVVLCLTPIAFVAHGEEAVTLTFYAPGMSSDEVGYWPVIEAYMAKNPNVVFEFN